ncbi:hypothetical protein F4859DRAFT_481411 [Xylaria cf. heliscus]|nr:hypothetical protein F4859DRAFT_481411 [Xylaria cf. heliscus]
MLLIHLWSLRRARLDLVTRDTLAPRTIPRTIPRTVPLHRFPRTRTPSQPWQWHSSRFQTTSTKASGPESVEKLPAPSYIYGSRLCVYHAGTARITFLACLKLSTLFIFAFFGFVVAPAYYDKDGLSPTVTRTALCAVVPLVFVAYTTSPFVTFIHMRLPPFARQSEEMLRRYARTLSPQTELEITTMSVIAKPRVSRVKLADLAPVNRRLGIVNLARDTAADNATRRWYMFSAVGNFNVQRASGTSKAPWVWDAIWNLVHTKSLR